MATTVKLKKYLHRKSWEMCAAIPTSSSSTGSFFVGDHYQTTPCTNILYMVGGGSASTSWYDPTADGWFFNNLTTNLAGTHSAGASAVFNPISFLVGGTNHTFTAKTSTLNSTTAIHIAITASKNFPGVRIRCTAGTNAGWEGEIVSNTMGPQTLITVTPAASSAFDNTSTFMMFAGSYWVNSSWTTLASGNFVVFDVFTNTWTAKSQTNLPASFGTHGNLVSANHLENTTQVYASAYSTTSITLKTVFNTNYLANKTLNILSGTGAGQKTIISTNTNASTGSVVNFATLTTAPDATSKMLIEGIYSAQATSGSATTVTVSGANWLTDCWKNYVVRIIGGTNAGKFAVITTNTNTTLTFATMTVANDSTTKFQIDMDFTKLYLIGNAAVALYRYDLTSNAWDAAAVTVNVARSAAPGAGCTSAIASSVTDWMIAPTDVSIRANSTAYSVGQRVRPIGTTSTFATNQVFECSAAGTSAASEGAFAVGIGSTVTDSGATFTRIFVPQNGRYLYSIRGGGSTLIDILDLTNFTWTQMGSGATMVYSNMSENLTTSTCGEYYKDYFYLFASADFGKMWKFNFSTNTLEAWNVMPSPYSTSSVGKRMFIKPYRDNETELMFVYTNPASRAEILRALDIS